MKTLLGFGILIVGIAAFVFIPYWIGLLFWRDIDTEDRPYAWVVGFAILLGLSLVISFSHLIGQSL